MGVDIGHVIVFGVELPANEIFSIGKKSVYGCQHKEDINAYCPQCGRQSKHEVKTCTPKIQLPKDWRSDIVNVDPVINEKYFLYCDIDDYYRDADSTKVYIGTYLKFLQASRGCYDSGCLSIEQLNDNVIACREMVNFLSSVGIKCSIEDCKLHIVYFVH